ncbi:amidohydrolase family protein [Candidatus Latescibacterota bacterium]
MIIDINCWTGHWATHPLQGDAAAVRASVQAVGVDRLCLSPLSGVLAHNPHVANESVYAAAAQWDEVLPVPLLDPTIPTWTEELERAREHEGVSLVKWLPAYSQYLLAEADECADAIAGAGLGLIVQVRLEDPRRQHPLAVVGDADASEVVELARRHPDLTVMVGGAAWGTLRQHSAALLELPNLYADMSQADGMDGVKLLVEAGLTAKLLFGTHAPFFVPLAAVSRVMADIDDESAAAILGGNAAALLA